MADLSLSPDKKILITGDEDGEVKIWNIADREVLQTITAHKNGLLSITVSADGKRFATLGKDGQVKLWETDSGKLLREWELKTPVTAFAFLPGNHLLTANANASMYVLDLP
jgi:WD40 repeat protein